MSVITTTLPNIQNVKFTQSEMVINLSNNRFFTVPLNEFPKIQALTHSEREDFEIIDDTNLSFLAIDDIYSVNELIGIK
ncbi:hypothetical protein [Marivirga sp.]|uniref:hypothetical protein n=1 Tax=Marivirga sp. TaxID=2018662 RepID=UPI0025DF4E93|nr:hypothetical protein [Marivirga sp.]